MALTLHELPHETQVTRPLTWRDGLRIAAEGLALSLVGWVLLCLLFLI